MYMSTTNDLIYELILKAYKLSKVVDITPVITDVKKEEEVKEKEEDK